MIIFVFVKFFSPLKENRGDFHYRLLKFALENGWNVSFNSTKLQDLRTTGALFFAESEPNLAQNVRGDFGGFYLENPREKWIFQKILLTKWNFGGFQEIQVDFARAELPRKVPHILINSRKNKFSVQTAGYLKIKVKTEGNFNDFFQIFVPPNYERDALQILTPDVLRAFLDFGTNFDFELLDDKFYVFASGGTLENSTSFKRLLAAIIAISTEISHQTKTYSDFRTEKFTVDENGDFSAASAKNQISAGGARFAKKWWAILIPIGSILSYFALKILGEVLKNL